MRRVAMLGVLALVAVMTAGCMGDDEDSSARRAAIGTSTPAAGEASIQSPTLLATPIKVSKWDWKATIPVNPTSGMQTAAPQLSAFTIKKNIDNASTNIFKVAVTGQTIATLTFKVGTSLTYVLTNVKVQSVGQIGDGTQGDEEVVFQYQKIQMTNVAAGTSPTACFSQVSGPC